MKLTSLVAGVIAIAALSGCGSDGPSVLKSQNSGGSGEIPADISDGTSFSVETAAKQLAKRFEVSSYEVDGSSVTFTIEGAKPEESKLISNCQISTTVLDSVAADEIDTVVLAYSDGELTCADLLK